MVALTVLNQLIVVYVVDGHRTVLTTSPHFTCQGDMAEASDGRGAGVELLGKVKLANNSIHAPSNAPRHPRCSPSNHAALQPHYRRRARPHARLQPQLLPPASPVRRPHPPSVCVGMSRRCQRVVRVLSLFSASSAVSLCLWKEQISTSLLLFGCPLQARGASKSYLIDSLIKCFRAYRGLVQYTKSPCTEYLINYSTFVLLFALI